MYALIVDPMEPTKATLHSDVRRIEQSLLENLLQDVFRELARYDFTLKYEPCITPIGIAVMRWVDTPSKQAEAVKAGKSVWMMATNALTQFIGPVRLVTINDFVWLLYTATPESIKLMQSMMTNAKSGTSEQSTIV